MKPGTKLPPDEWAAQFRVYPKTAGKPGPRDPTFTPYMIPFARAVASGKYRRVVAVTFAQGGKTDTVLDIIGARLDQRPAPVIYVGPTREFLTDQLEPRVMQLFDQVPTLSEKLIRGRLMKKTLKWIAGTRLRLAHAGSSTALKSDPAALALIDEYDSMLRNVQKQGDPLGLVEARGETYADFVTGVTSTPSTGAVDTMVDPETHLEFWKRGEPEEIESAIWRLWQEGTRYHWSWPCPHCGEYFIPRLKWLRWPKGVTPYEAGQNAYLECPRCGEHILDEEKAAMNARGRYVAPGQSVTKDGEVVGRIQPNSVCSFWVSGLASPFSSWGKRCEDYLIATESGDPDRIQTVTNAEFGELYTPGGGEVPEWREVLAHRLPYSPGDVPDGVAFIVASIDVQRNRLIYGIRGWGARATSWLIDNGEIWGPTERVEVWSELDDLLSSSFGGKSIKVAFIDSGFRPGRPDIVPENRVYEFCRTHQRFVFPVKGADTMATPLMRRKIEVTPQGGAAKYGLELIRLNTDWWKLWIFERIRWPLDQPGAWFIHENADEGYARQVTSEARTKGPSGKPVWVTRSRENHYLDVEAMNAAAAYMLGAHRIGGRGGPTGRGTRGGAPVPPGPRDAPPAPAEAGGEAPAAKPIADRFADMARRLSQR